MIREWQEAFILHQRPYGNTSVIAEVFTRNYGRVSVLARGAKNPKSKFFGYLTPFSKLKIMVSGRSDLKTLTHIERDNYHFSESLSTHSFSLLYVNEIMMQILPQQAIAAELFNLYENSPQIKINIPYKKISKNTVNYIKNINKKKLKDKNIRLLIRLSGTEPLIRILVEGNDLNKVSTIAKNIKKNIWTKIGKK